MRRLNANPGHALRYALAALALWWAAPGHAQNLMLFAAVSMKDVLEEIVRGYDPGPGTRVLSAFAASSALARQIEQGAPADVFVSADQASMDYLAQRRLIDAATRAELAGNRLVLVAPADHAVDMTIEQSFPLAQALGDGRLSIADPAHVPAGRYAHAALVALGVWDSVRARLAPADNVRAALNFVARGEAPLGIVYQTDAAAERRVRVAGVFPAGSHPEIRYPAAVVAASANPQAARRLLAHLRSAQAAAVFARHGFIPIR
jgi:molybdate transport system substrate-binding protein